MVQQHPQSDCRCRLAEYWFPDSIVPFEDRESTKAKFRQMLIDEGGIIEVRAAEEPLVDQTKTRHLADQSTKLSYMCNEAVSTASQ